MIVDQHGAFPDYLELIAPHDDSRVFVQADAQHMRVSRYELDQLELTIPREHVLVDCAVLDETEADLMIANDLAITRGVTPRQERPLYRCPGGSSSDHSSALEHPVELPLGQRAQIGIGQSPLDHLQQEGRAPTGSVQTDRCQVV